MAKRTRKQEERALQARPESPSYEIGYGKPPVHSRFKPGQSGNPRGRPKGARNKRPGPFEERLKGIILEEAYRAIPVNDGDGQISVPMAQAVVRAMAINAAKGNPRAQRLFTELVLTTEREDKQDKINLYETAVEYKLSWEQELQRRERLGIEGPDPLPHPDHVIIDPRSGEVRIVGPVTREEKDDFELFLRRKTETEAERDKLERILQEEPDCPHRDKIAEDLESAKRVLEIIKKYMPDWSIPSAKT